MVEETTAYVEMYLTKEGLNNLTKPQMITILQLLRITNALRFQMSLLLHTMDEKDRLFRLRSQLEIYAILASSFKEASKEFYNNLFKVLRPLSEESELLNALVEYDIKTRNYKDDEVLRLIDYIRNNFSFHIRSGIFDNYIVEGDAKEDMIIGIAKSEKVVDWCFLKAYDALIFQVSEMAKSPMDKAKIPDWLFDKILHEADYFCKLLEKFAGSILKKYGVKKIAMNSNI
jgi:hypothetical protein